MKLLQILVALSGATLVMTRIRSHDVGEVHDKSQDEEDSGIRRFSFGSPRYERKHDTLFGKGGLAAAIR